MDIEDYHGLYQVSGKGTWKRNPYVWVYKFNLVKI